MKKISIGLTIQVKKAKTTKTISLIFKATTFGREKTNRDSKNTFKNFLNENKAYLPSAINILQLTVLIIQFAMILFGNNLAAIAR